MKKNKYNVFSKVVVS
jgi:potassium/chloride transporter 4/5/6